MAPNLSCIDQRLSKTKCPAVGVLQVLLFGEKFAT